MRAERKHRMGVERNESRNKSGMCRMFRSIDPVSHEFSSQEFQAMVLDDRGFPVVKALLDVCAITDADQIVQSIINLYCDANLAWMLISTFIREEVNAARHESTLFRFEWVVLLILVG